MIYFKNPYFIEKKINKHIKNKKKNFFFCIPMFPYPSGKLHLGHLKNYILSDIISKFKKLKNFNVLHPIAWDAFGSPAENVSIKYNLNPEKWTISNIKFMKKQMNFFSIDYSKLEFSTCDIKFYKWEFYILILLIKNNLLKKKKSIVYWDNFEKCILSNEQVKNNKGWRSNSDVNKIKINTWFINLKKYSLRLLSDLKYNNWSKTIKNIQKKWIKIFFFFFFKKKKFYLNIYNTININEFIFFNNKKIIFLIIKKIKKNIISSIKIFYFNKIEKKKKKIILINYYIKKKKLNIKKINLYIKKKNTYYLKLTNLKNWAFLRNRKWGSPFFYKKVKNNNFKNNKTLDTFLQSSWYYLFYVNTKNINNEKKMKLFPINVYVGGIEHVNLHLIYLRFLNKIFYDLNIINKKEVILNFVNNGLINNKVYYKIKNNNIIFCKYKKKEFFYGIEKMSKSKKNGINPIKIIKKIGADILRLYLVTNKPLNKNLIWDSSNFENLKKFLLFLNKNILNFNKNFKKLICLEKFFNIKKIHTIISVIKKILLINNSISQIKIIIYYLYPIIPNLSKIFWFKTGSKIPIEKFNFNFINKKEYKVYFNKKFLKNIYNLNILNITIKNYKISKIFISMDENSIIIL